MLVRYYIQAYDATGLRVNRWVRPEEMGCGSGIVVCALNADVILHTGDGWWQVIAWNPTGYSGWSGALTFHVMN